jgi:outer membrane biogenesis lipoprotein LolB
MTGASSVISTAGLGLGLALLLTACGARAPIEPPAPLHTGTPTALELDLRISERRAALSRFRGQARLKYRSADEKGRVSQMIAVEEPNRIRIDFMSPFGPTYTVAANGRTLVAYDRGEKILYRGEPSVQNIFSYTRVSASIELLASLIRGLPPEVERLGQATVREEEDGWHWVAALRGGGLLTVIFQKGTLLPLSASIVGSKAMGELTARFSDYEDVEGISAPHRIEAPSGVRLVDMATVSGG